MTRDDIEETVREALTGFPLAVIKTGNAQSGSVMRLAPEFASDMAKVVADAMFLRFGRIIVT